MQESKEIGPHITKKEELDVLYRNNKTPEFKQENKDLPDNQGE